MLPLLLLACAGEGTPGVPGPEVVLRVHDPVRSEVALGQVLFTAFSVDDQQSWAVLLGGSGSVRWSLQGEPGVRLIRAHPGSDGQSVVTLSNDVRGERTAGLIERHFLDGGEPVTTRVPHAHHDLLELEGAFAYLEHAYAQVALTPGSDILPVAADAIAVVPEGTDDGSEVAFDFFRDYEVDPWWVCEHMSAETGWLPGFHEWTHGNSLVRHPTDDAYLVMARYLDAILKIDAVTGEVLWQLGGRDSDFALGPGAAFVHGHFSHAFDDRLLVFDNGDDHGGRRAPSRVVELVVDEQRRTADLAWELPDPRGEHTGFLGDARRLPGGNTLVSFSQQHRIAEYTPEGHLVWEIEVPGLAVGRVTFWPH